MKTAFDNSIDTISRMVKRKTEISDMLDIKEILPKIFVARLMAEFNHLNSEIDKISRRM